MVEKNLNQPIQSGPEGNPPPEPIEEKEPQEIAVPLKEETPLSEPESPPPPKTFKHKNHEEADKAYKELETKLGQQGSELGTLRQLIERLTVQPPQNGQQQAPPQLPVEDKTPARPKMEAFDDVDKYDEALEEWRLERVRYEMRQTDKRNKVEAQTRTIQETQRQVAQRIIEEHNVRVEKAKETDPGLEDIIKTITNVSDPMAWVIRQSEDGPKIIRYLHENPKERDRVYNMAPTLVMQDGRVVPVPGKDFRPFMAAVEMGKIIERLNKPETKPNRQSNAPAPHSPVGGTKGSGASEDKAALAKSNPDKYIEWALGDGKS